MNNEIVPPPAPQPGPWRNADGSPYGHPPAAPTQEASVQEAPPREAPVKRKRALLLGILSGALVVLLLLVGGGIWFFTATDRNAPAKKVGDFLTALVAGRAEEAMRLSGNELTDQEKLLINDAVYQKASDRISSFTLGATRISGGKATVTANLSQGNADYTEDFILSGDGKDFFVDKWKLDPVTLPVLNIQLSGPPALGLTAAGVELKPDVVPATSTRPEQFKKLALKALPGSYEVATAKQNAQMTSNKSMAKITGFSSAKPQNAVVAVTLTDAGKAAVTAAVNQYLDSCAAQQSALLKDCPFSGKADDPTLAQYQVSNPKWTIVTRPTLTISEWTSALGWLVVSSAPGAVSFSADIANGGGIGTARIDSAAFSLGGQILSFKDGAAQFSRPPQGVQS